jgi:hypothetical protein
MAGASATMEADIGATVIGVGTTTAAGLTGAGATVAEGDDIMGATPRLMALADASNVGATAAKGITGAGGSSADGDGTSGGDGADDGGRGSGDNASCQGRGARLSLASFTSNWALQASWSTRAATKLRIQTSNSSGIISVATQEKKGGRAGRTTGT